MIKGRDQFAPTTGREPFHPRKQSGPAANFMSALDSIMPKTDDFYEGYIRPSKHQELTDILEQLRNYPTPISDCDEQFNDLLKERDRLQQSI